MKNKKCFINFKEEQLCGMRYFSTVGFGGIGRRAGGNFIRYGLCQRRREL